MKNAVKTTVAGLLTQADQCVVGATQYGDTIGLKHHATADIQTDIDGVVNDGVAYDQANVQLTTLRENRLPTIANAKVFLSIACELLKTVFGKVWSEKWVPAGFIHNLRIPDRFGDIQARVHAMAKFLETNPTLAKTDVNLTAVYAMTLFNALNKAQGDINTQRTHVQNMAAGRKSSVKKLRKRVRGVIVELGQLLDPMDNRWSSFGLNKPGAQPVPTVPFDVTVVLLGANALSVGWGPSTYANYYRVWAKVVGVDEDFVNVGDSTNLEFTIQPLAAGAQVQVAVSAVSTGGESAKSEIVVATIPA